MTIRDEIDRKLTQAFIYDNPVVVSLSRPEIENTSAGGKRQGTPTLITEQTFTKINYAFRAGASEYTDADGHVIVPDFILVGQGDADVEVNDSFELDGNTYKVFFVDVSREQWAKRAAVTRRVQ